LKKVLLARVLKLLRLLCAVGLVAGMTFLYTRVVSVNNVTVALTFLLAVLAVATWWGLPEALAASVAGVLCFDYFFLPPIGNFTITDPQNWAALFAFVATALIVSQLSAHAQKQALESSRRQRELEQLYTLSRNLLLLDNRQPLAQQIAQQVAQVFELPGVAFFDRISDRIYRAGPHDIPVEDSKLRDAALQGTVFHDAAERTTIMPINLGGPPIGSLAIQGTSVSEAALQSVASLTAITLERAHVQDVATRAEAARQSEELKSTLLDALAHEFKTPLTPIKAAVTSMLSDGCSSPTHQELLHIINEEVDRLNTMLTEAIQMSRIEAGQVHLHQSPQSISSLVRAQLERLAESLEGRKMTVEVPEDLPRVTVDPEFIGIVIWQLLNNAVRYTPPGSSLTLRARTEGAEVIVSLADCGAGISEAEQQKIFEKFYRGKTHRDRILGTGVGLTIAQEIVRAHQGRIWVESQPGKGASFSFSVPCAPGESST
jgi:two-component system sensor histidine kinase KdpD